MIALHFVNEAGVPARALRAAERALTIQVNRDVRPWWRVGRIAFRRRGWRVLAVQPSLLGGGLPTGWHGIDHSGHPFAYVLYQHGWTQSISHEVLEMLLDPYGRSTASGYKREICDPVQAGSYTVAGVTVSDFVTPAWFEARSRGPWDALRTLTGPGQLGPFGFSTRAAGARVRARVPVRGRAPGGGKRRRAPARPR